MKKLAIFPLLLFILISNACEKGIFIPAYNPDDELDQQLNSIYENGQLPGFAVAIINKEGILFEKAIGYADLATKEPFTNTTQQNIASLTKTFVGITLMRAISEGKVGLDTPINDILPFAVHHPNHPTVSITIRHLATHTSSIDDHEIEYESVFLKDDLTLNKKAISKENYQFMEKWSKNRSLPLEEFLKTTLLPNGVNYSKIRFLTEAPGDKYKYSNLGTSLLAYTLSIAIEQPIEQYIKENILQPISMTNTRWNFEETGDVEQATTYFQNQLVVPQYQSILYPSGGLHSTLSDLSLYLIEILKMHQGEGDLLSTVLFKEMITPQLTSTQSPPSTTKNRGFLWELNDQQAGHNGGNYGVTLFMAFDKEKNYARLFMTNISSYEDQKLIPQMVEVWKLLEKEGARLSE